MCAYLLWSVSYQHNYFSLSFRLCFCFEVWLLAKFQWRFFWLLRKTLQKHRCWWKSPNIHFPLLIVVAFKFNNIFWPNAIHLSFHIIVSQLGFPLADAKWFVFKLKPTAASPPTILHLPLILCPKSSIQALAHPSMHLITVTLNLSLL